MQWLILLLLLGASFTLWIGIGLARLISEARRRSGSSDARVDGACRLSAADVAVVIPAHNEKLGIAATIAAVLRLVPARNVHVVADGCVDDTAAIARAQGVHVLELHPGQGKAGGIEAALDHFDIARRFAMLLIADADTELDEHYVERGLRLLDDDEMVALAGYARTTWHPNELPFMGRLLVAYRTRLYAVMQWMKYGQTWRHTNVASIVPGFASMYRTAVLPHMDLNPPGLVIEDFNMTFELHHKGLGKIAFLPSVFAKTQDPDNLPDYYRQITRWWLGFWQTLRRHKLWFSWFSAALALFLLEVVLASIVIILIAVAILLLALPPLTGGLVLQWGWFASFAGLASPLFSPVNLFLFLFLPDYLLTCFAAIWTRRPSLLVYGFFFLPIRLVDATATLRTMPQAWTAHSNGQWQSPTRRAVATLPDDNTVEISPDETQGLESGTTSRGNSSVPVADPSPAPPARSRKRSSVLLDAVVIGTILLLTAAATLVLPVLLLVAGGLVAVIAAAVLNLSGFHWDRRRGRRVAIFAILAIAAVIHTLLSGMLAR